ncbi:MAG: rhomboid family intramembrane serine protease [Hyphomicrobiaceae bacterium]|nr:MAG: rhomboid family intramembrane serine protease [Hyphomicrobiaceae bacterium]
MSHREPIFNVPGVVVWLLAAFLVVHVLRAGLPDEQSTWLTAALAFIPARFGGSAAELPGGQLATATSLVTHLFVHGDLTHLAINSAWLLAFATPVARRTDVPRFFAFFLLAGIAGALTFLAFNGPVMTLVVGASGAISGLMGAAFRFLFGPGGASSPPDLGGGAQPAPLMGLAATLRDRRVLLAVLGWTVINSLLAWGAAGLTDAGGIAWEAHLGGFYMGLLTFGLFDRASFVQHDVGDDMAGPR